MNPAEPDNASPDERELEDVEDVEDVEDDEPEWDADDERRQHDQMAPPKEPCECYCLHCNRVFMSDQMWLQRVINYREGFDGFWMCPTPNCGGAGFTFDIFPTDPDHPANAGWHSFEDGGDEEDSEGDYDPDEAKYKGLDDELADDDHDDIEGEEWKYGLAPGEQPPEPEWAEESRREWEEEQKKYDAPDERPRVLDWSDRAEDAQAGGITEDDIPF